MTFRILHSALFFLLLSSLLLSSCIKENEGKTVALIGTEYYIEDILTVIPDSLQAEFKTMFNGYPEGSIPDKIEGTYQVAPNLLKQTNLEIPTPRIDPDVYLRFSKQNNGTMTMELLQETLVQTTAPVFVMGNNKEFTVWFIEDKDVDDQNRMKRGVVMCGRWTDNGLANFRMAFVILESEGAKVPAPGSYYYYEDGNGLAQNCDWPL